MISLCETHTKSVSHLLSHSFHPHNGIGRSTLLFSFHDNEIDSKRVTELPKVTWLVSGKVKIPG